MSITAVSKRQGEAARGSLESLVTRFESERSAVEVNFRQLVTDFGIAKSAHAIHPYPAKLLVNIPKYFLSALTTPDSLLLNCSADPGPRLRRRAYRVSPLVEGFDLARLITRAKLTAIDREAAREQLAEVMAAHPTANSDRAGRH